MAPTDAMENERWKYFRFGPLQKGLIPSSSGPRSNPSTWRYQPTNMGVY
jgi:hypothetical protein